jgi:predicted nucleic acid-binding protein
VSIAEIFAGARRGEERRIENLFLILEAITLSSEVGRKAGHYLRAYAGSHGVEVADALIAATASVHELPLWTLNRKHYPMRDIELFSPRH